VSISHRHFARSCMKAVNRDPVNSPGGVTERATDHEIETAGQRSSCYLPGCWLTRRRIRPAVHCSTTAHIFRCPGGESASEPPRLADTYFIARIIQSEWADHSEGNQVLLLLFPQIMRSPITVELGVICKAEPTHGFDPIDHRSLIHSDRCCPAGCHE